MCKTDTIKGKILNIKLISILFFLFAIAVGFYGCDGCSPKPCIGCNERPNIDTLAKLLNPRLEYTQIVKNSYPSLCGDNKDVYEIALRPDILSNTYYFEVCQYIIETGGDVSLG